MATGLLGAGILGYQSDIPRRNRQEILAELDPIAREHGKYTAYQLSKREFIGMISAVDGNFGFADLGYEANPLAAAKFHPETEALDDHSLRRVDPDNPRWQWHVHLWEKGDEVAETFSHYEYRPDIRRIDGESFTEMRQRIREHYNPKRDSRYDADEATYFVGMACSRVQEAVA